MKKLLLLFLLIPSICFADNLKVSQMSQKSTAGDYDLLYLVDMDESAAQSKSITVTHFKTSLFSTLNALNGLTFSNGDGTYVAKAIGTDVQAYSSILNSFAGTNRTTGYLYWNGSSYSYGSSSGMIYPSSGIAVSTGLSWGTSITDNHTNWDTAYSWGNPSGVYLPLHSKADTSGNADTVTNGVYTTSKISALSATTSAELAGVLSDEVGIGKLAFDKHLRFTIIEPLTAYNKSSTICIVPKLDAAITITNLEVTLDATSNEVLGDIKWANAFIGLGTATLINDFDTTSGARTDSSITSGAVASGKCIYLSFDSAPNSVIKIMNVDLTYNY